MSSRRVVCVLAGGRSSRFGRSKIHLHIGSEPILAWQARRLAAGFDAELWLNLAPEPEAESSAEALPPGAASYQRIVRDPQPHEGPLVAIAHLLNVADEAGMDQLYIVPADMPLITGDHLAQLGAVLKEGASAALAMGRWQDGPRAGSVEPLPLACRLPGARHIVTGAVDAGARGPRALGDDSACVHLPLTFDTDGPAWLNINRPDDLAAIEAQLGLAVR